MGGAGVGLGALLPRPQGERARSGSPAQARCASMGAGPPRGFGPHGFPTLFCFHFACRPLGQLCSPADPGGWACARRGSQPWRTGPSGVPPAAESGARERCPESTAVEELSPGKDTCFRAPEMPQEMRRKRNRHSKNEERRLAASRQPHTAQASFFLKVLDFPYLSTYGRSPTFAPAHCVPPDTIYRYYPGSSMSRSGGGGRAASSAWGRGSERVGVPPAGVDSVPGKCTLNSAASLPQLNLPRTQFLQGHPAEEEDRPKPREPIIVRW